MAVFLISHLILCLLFAHFLTGHDRGSLKRKVKVKVKCTLVQALMLCTGRTAHRESTGIALPFLDHGTRRW